MLIDVIVVVIILGFIIGGWKRGLLLSVYSLVSLIAAIALACMLTPFVSAGLEKTGIQDRMETKISAYAESELTEHFGAGANVDSEKAADALLLPEFIMDKISGTDGPIQSVSQNIGRRSAELICRVIAFFIVFIIVGIILLVLKFVLKLAARLPLIKQADAVGGILIGFAQGILFVCVLALLLSVFSSAESVRSLISAVDRSHIAKFFYENNFIGKIISGLL